MKTAVLKSSIGHSTHTGLWQHCSLGTAWPVSCFW